MPNKAAQKSCDLQDGARAGVRIVHVDPDSHAARAGIHAGDHIISINSHPIRDAIDIRFHETVLRARVHWRCVHDNRVRAAVILKSFDEPVGLELEPFPVKTCQNKCVFCFVRQLPRGLRRELYVRDEDYRLSFLHGNYITGGNLAPEDLRRIMRMKLSPLYFSIHATEPSVRETLLGRKGIAPIMPLLRRLTRAGIVIHTQIVLCPGINDGAVLERTVAELAALYPGISTAAVVPVGLTAHRRGLPRLEPVKPDFARAFLAQCARLQRNLRQSVGNPFVFASDEFYLIAGRTPPSYARHDELPQLANGVGMVSLFYQDMRRAIAEMPLRLPSLLRVAAITTAMNVKTLQRLADEMRERTANLSVALLPVANSLFGADVTVSGLLPGRDFERAIHANPGFDRYLVPENAMRPWDTRFLDDMLFDELKAAAGADVASGGVSAGSFIAAALGR